MWIHLPSTCCPSVRVSADSNSASSWRSRLLARYASSKGRLFAAKYWLKEWKTVAWTNRLFGRIYEPLTASLGVASWIASLAATRANPFLSSENSKGHETNDGCGHISPASSVRSNRGGVSSRTSATTYEWASNKSKMSFDKWVTSLRQVCSLRQRSGPLTDARGFSSWRTPTTSDVGTPLSKLTTKEGNPPQFGRRMYRTGKDGTRVNQTQSLGLQASLWYSLRIQMTGKAGIESSTRPQLNPLFVEWLMGFPPGWTACEPVATASYQQWRHLHGRLLSAF